MPAAFVEERQARAIGHRMIESTEYEGRHFRIHLNREKYKRICTHLDAFEKLFFDHFIAGLINSISGITFSSHPRSHTDMGFKLATFQMNSAISLMKHDCDLLGPGYLLSQPAERFEVSKQDHEHYRAEGVLLRVLEFSISKLVYRAESLQLRHRTPIHSAVRFLAETLRVAAYRLARMIIILGPEKGGSKIFPTE